MFINKLYKREESLCKVQGDKKVSVHLIITNSSSGVQRLFDHPVQVKLLLIIDLHGT